MQSLLRGRADSLPSLQIHGKGLSKTGTDCGMRADAVVEEDSDVTCSEFFFKPRLVKITVRSPSFQRKWRNIPITLKTTTDGQTDGANLRHGLIATIDS